MSKKVFDINSYKHEMNSIDHASANLDLDHPFVEELKDVFRKTIQHLENHAESKRIPYPSSENTLDHPGQQFERINELYETIRQHHFPNERNAHQILTNSKSIDLAIPHAILKASMDKLNNIKDKYLNPKIDLDNEDKTDKTETPKDTTTTRIKKAIKRKKAERRTENEKPLSRLSPSVQDILISRPTTKSSSSSSSNEDNIPPWKRKLISIHKIRNIEGNSINSDRKKMFFKN